MSQLRSEPRCSQDRIAPALGCLNWLLGIVVWAFILGFGALVAWSVW